jgi:hypothetical protein
MTNVKNVIVITTAQLVDMLKEIDGKSSKFLSFTYIKDADIYKRKQVFDSVKQFTKVHATMNANYQATVNNALVRNGLSATFLSGNRSWGAKKDEYNGCIVYKENGDICLQYFLNKRTDKFFADGKLTDEDKITELKPVKKTEDFTITPDDLQGTDEEIAQKIMRKIKSRIRAIDVDKIDKLYHNGNIYKVVRSA